MSPAHPPHIHNPPVDKNRDEELISKLLGETPPGGVGGEDLNHPGFQNIDEREKQENDILNEEMLNKERINKDINKPFDPTNLPF
jgi:hypothetical protein